LATRHTRLERRKSEDTVITNGVAAGRMCGSTLPPARGGYTFFGAAGLNGFVNEMCSLREMGFGPAEVDPNKGTVTSQTFFHDSVLRTIDIPCMDGSGEEEVLVTLWRVQGIYLKWMGGQ